MQICAKTVILLTCLSPLFSQPSGFKLIQGEAASPPHLGNCAQVTSFGNAIIEWDDFSIGEQERFEFRQGSVADTVLNRVMGSLRSEILGELHSNGKIILVNPQGVFIGPNGRVDAASLIASSLDLSDEYFMSQNEFLFHGESMGEVVNLGTIEAGGEVFLLGPNVRNDGVIRGANVGLGVGRSILVRPEGSQRILIQIPIEEGELSHSGHIEGLKVELKSGAFAKAIQCSGVIDANRLEEHRGEIYLVADSGISEVSGSLSAEGGVIHVLGDTVHLLNGTEIDASGVDGGGEVLIGGDYQGKNPNVKNAKYVWAGNQTVVKADANESGNGGRVIFWADEVMSHFGKISIRGGEMGGNGGFAEVSGKSLDYRGFTDGGAPLGQPGTLLLDPNDIVIGASATTGSFTACVPPVSYTITSGTATNQILNTDLQTQLASCSVTISTVGSAGSGPNSGSITVSSAVTWSAATTLTMTAATFISLDANISSTSTSTGFTAMNFTANGTTVGNYNAITLATGVSITTGSPAGTPTSGGGGIIMTGNGPTSGISSDNWAGIRTNSGSSIRSAAGPIQLTGVGPTSVGNSGLYGILILSGTISTVDGAMTINGTGGQSTGSHNLGMYVTGGVIQATGTGSISISGTALRGTQYSSGCRLEQSGGIGGISVVNGSLTITGQGQQIVTSGGFCLGVLFQSSFPITSSGIGSITLTGTGGTNSAGSSPNCGVSISNNSSIVASGSGNVTINAIGGTCASGANHGIEFLFDSVNTGFISSQGSGTIAINGTAGSGNGSYGIQLGQKASILISTAASNGAFVLTGLPGTSSGAGPLYGINVGFNSSINFNASSSTSLSMTGTGGPGSGGSNYGVRVANTVTCNGAITINGTGGSGGSNNFGCFLGVGLTTQSGAITFGNSTATTVFLNTGLTLDTTNAGGTSGANISFTNAPISGAQALTLRAGTGSITLAKDVGASGTRLTGLTFTSGSGLTLGNNSTSSTVYTTGITFAPGMPVTLAGTETIDTNGSNINFSSTIGGSAQTLTLTANAGTITLGGDVGTTGARLTALTLTSNVGNAISLGGTLYVANGVTFTNANPLTLTAAAGIVTTNSAITVPATVNGAASFTLNAGSGAITLSGAIGGTTRPTALTITTTNTTANQGFLINNGTINLAGPFNATGATLTTIGTDTTVDTSNGGVSNGLIEFAGIKSVTSAAKSLSLASGTGNIFLHGDVGSSTANERLSALTITNSGSGTFGIGGTIYLTAFSNLTHNSRPLTVLSSLGTGGINSNNTAISFTQTIDAQTSGTGSFTLNAGTSTISLSGAIGGTTPLGPFTCTAATSIALPTSTKTAGGAIAMNGPVAMSAGVALDSTNGGLTAAGANISITGAVTGAQALTLRAGSAGGITFGSTVGTTLTRVTTLTLTSGASLSLGGSLFLTNSVAIPMATTLTGNAEINTGL